MLFEKQQYQIDCVDNILAVLQETASLTDLSTLKQGIKTLHENKKIPLPTLSNNPRLDVLMETGTGKTFTYIQTMYQLNKEHGSNKFIIFVPRLAIREGVIQNIDLTANYFFQHYGKRLKKYSYDGKAGIGQITAYIRNQDELSVLILTSASISTRNKAARILTRRFEGMNLANQSPLHAISKLNPVVFIDEPHLLKGDEFIRAYEQYFSAALCIRFGATFPSETAHKLSNVVYVLDSLSAFREYLVKQISVTTLIGADSGIRFLSYENPQVTLSYFKDNIEYSKKINIGADIGAAIGDNRYHDITIVKVKAKKVFLSNFTTHDLAKDDYTLDDTTVQQMISRTIAIHFAKEESLFVQGIKTLSLFFIPNINDFRGNNPRIKTLFEQEYKAQRTAILATELSPEYQQYLQHDYAENGELRVHEGYFSGDKGSKDEKEGQGIALILKDKESLLSTQTPLRFIFSVWALQEGWDNPNIFNICKLAASGKETSRRQQVGRGLRLAVNQQGKRQTIAHCAEDENQFYAINKLDVIVSGQEKNFIEAIQAEINANSYGFAGTLINLERLKKIGLNTQQANKLLNYLDDNGVIKYSEAEDVYYIQSPIADFMQENLATLPPVLVDIATHLIKTFKVAGKSQIKNANNPKRMVGIRADKFAEFESLWQQITRKAKIVYNAIDDAIVIDKIAAQFAQEPIDPIKIIAKTTVYNHQTDEIEHKNETTLGDARFFKRNNAYADFIKEFAQNQKLPLSFTLKLFSRLDKEKIARNPKKAARLLEQFTQNAIHNNIVQNIGYKFASDIKIGNNSRDVFYHKGKPREAIEAGKIGSYHDGPTQAHYLYDAIVYDSEIEKDVITKDPPSIDEQKITVFAKLPRITIPTPYKSYSPDFAYYVERTQGKKLFLVVETKGYNSESDIPNEEKMKIAYAEKFFTLLNEEMRAENIEIIFKKRINQQSLNDLLQQIGDGDHNND